MKKFLKNLAVASCIVPCVLLATGCGKKTDNPDTTLTVEQQNQAFGYLKTLSATSPVQAGKTTTIVEKNSLEVSMDVSNDVLSMMGLEDDAPGTEGGKTAKEKFQELMESGMGEGSNGSSSDSKQVMAYKENGEGYYEGYEYDDETHEYVLSGAEYVKKVGNDYILYQAYYGDEVQKSAYKVGSDYASHNVSEALSSGEENELSLLQQCSNLEEFKSQLKEFFIDKMADTMDLTDSIANLTVSIDLKYKNNKYELEASLVGEDIDVDIPMVGSMNLDLNATAKIVYTQSEILSNAIVANIDMDMEMDLMDMIGGMMQLADETPSESEMPSMIIGVDTSMSMSIEETYSDTFDESKLTQNFSSYVDGEIEKIDTTFDVHYVDLFENECSFETEYTLKFGDTIDWNELKEELDDEMTSRFYGEGCTFEYYLDSAFTKQANATNLEKAPSYPVYVYVKVVEPAQA